MSFWNRIARNIARRPALVDWIIRIGEQSPYLHLFHSDGTDYMGRWWLMPSWMLGRDENGNLYPFKWLPRIIRLHHIRSEDWDRDLHDHPAEYRTIILRGWYLERDIYGAKHLRQQGDTKKASAETFHNIVAVSPGGVWTIFIMKKKTNNWGFLVGGRKIPWRKYEGRK